MSSDQALANKPTQKFMIRDYRIRGAVRSATTEGGVRLGLTVPDEDNLGGLAPVVLGDPTDDTDDTVGLRITNGGSIATAQWTWSDSNGIDHGANDDFYRWGVHNPTATQNQGAVVCYSSIYRRIVVASVDNSFSPSRVRVSYAELNDRPQSSDDWSTATFTPTNGEYGSSHSLAICELRDGTLLLAVRRTDGDFDFYRSQDGGSNWSLATEAFLATQIARSPDALTSVHEALLIQDKITPKLAAAGDWVRFVAGYTTSVARPSIDGGLVTYTSSDSGASWAFTGIFEDTTDIQACLSSVQDNDQQPFALVALDASTGAFGLVANPPTSGDTNKVRLWYASRGDDWEMQTVFGQPPIDPTPRAYAAWTDPTFLYVWVYAGDNNTPNDGWLTYRARRESVLDDDAWQGPAQIDPDDGITTDNNLTREKTWGASRLIPIQVTAAWCDDRAAICGYLQDQEESPPVTRKAPRPFVQWVGGWSRRPWSVDPIANEGYTEALHWMAEQGDPAGEATSSGDAGHWSTTLSGAGTHSWSAALYVETSTTLGAATQKAYLEHRVSSGALGGAKSWTNTTGQPWDAEWVAAVGHTVLAVLPSSTSAGIYFEMPDDVGGGGYGWKITIAMGKLNAFVFSGTTPLLTISGLQLDTAEAMQFHRFRFAVAPATSPSAPTAVLQYKPDNGDAWQESDPFSLGVSTSVGATQQVTRFGLLSVGGVSADTYLSRWREVRIASANFAIDYTDFDADRMPGALASPRPRALSAGSTATDPSRLRAAWGGAGGVIGDAWSHTLDHDYPAAALAFDSPQLGWRSAVGATAGQRIVFDACGGDASADDGSRWVHSGLALYGLGHLQTIVTYSDDAAGTSNAVSATLTGTQYTGIRVFSQVGRVLRLNLPTGAWRDGDLSGRYFKVTAASSSAVLGHVHRIERHLVGDDGSHRIELDADGQFISSAPAISAGDSLTIFSDRLWASYGSVLSPRRYMTLQFGATGDNNWGGYWACGSVVPGIERTWSPPLLWTHTDEDQPYVTVQRARGGQSWAFQEAPNERTWTGRQQGALAGERQAFRDAMRYLAKGGEEPIALLLDSEATADQDRKVLLTRYTGPVNLDNQAYYRSAGSTSQALAVGDLGVSFQELS